MNPPCEGGRGRRLLKSTTSATATKAAASEAATAETSASASEASATHEDGRTTASWSPIVRVGRLGLSGKGMPAILTEVGRLFGDEAVGT